MEPSAPMTSDSGCVDFQNNTRAPSMSVAKQSHFELDVEQNLTASRDSRLRSAVTSGSVSSATSGYASFTSGSSLEQADDTLLSPDPTQQSKAAAAADPCSHLPPSPTPMEQEPLSDSDVFKRPLPVQTTNTGGTDAAMRAVGSNTAAAQTHMMNSAAALQAAPNVSLSPIIEQRFPSISSISSGRSDSFDDDLMTMSQQQQQYVANVLVVSHGGLIGQLIAHFRDDLSCDMPRTCDLPATAPRPTPNASISRFDVTLPAPVDGRAPPPPPPPSIVCLSLYDDNHLQCQEMMLTSFSPNC